MMAKLMLSICLIIGAITQNAVAGGKGFSGYPVNVTIIGGYNIKDDGDQTAPVPYISGSDGRLSKLDEVFNSNQKFSFRITQDGISNSRKIINNLDTLVPGGGATQTYAFGSLLTYNDFAMPTPLNSTTPSFFNIPLHGSTYTSAEIRAYSAELGTGIVFAFGGGFTLNAPDTDKVLVTHNGPNEWTIDILPNTRGRLFIGSAKGTQRDQGLYFYTGRLIIDLQ